MNSTDPSTAGRPHTAPLSRRAPLVLASLLSLAPSAGCQTVHTEQPALAGQDVRLTIIHTADLHSRLFPYQFAPGAIDRGLGLVPSQGDIAIVGGAARMATAIRCIRGDEVACNLKLNDSDKTVSELVGGSAARNLHLDSGDIFEGAPVFNTFAGEVEMRAMTRMGLNAMALGNHEFDKGAVTLELMKTKFGAFPILAANYVFADPKDYTQPKLRQVIGQYSIFNVQGLRVGVIGLGNLSSLQGIIEGGNSLGVQPLEATSAIKNAVNFIRGQVDVVVMISHLGLDEDEGIAQTDDAADQNPIIDGVDVVLGGHLHIVLNPPKDLPRYDEAGNPTGHTVLCHSGAFAKYVGRLDLAVHVADPKVPGDRNNVKSYTYKLIPIDNSIPEDAEMANMLEPYQLRMNTLLNLTHNYAVVPCPAGVTSCPKVLRNDPDGGDSQLGNLVAASMRLRARVEADFGLTNSLGIRADFESGPLNLEQLYNVFPFDNTITTMFLSGREIHDTLDFIAARSSERGCKTQSQVSGIWFVMDCTTKRACGPIRRDGTPAQGCDDNWTELTHKSADGTQDLPNVDGPPLLGDHCVNADRSPNPGARCYPMLPAGEYRVAVNDYIASGGSGFAVLKRNTTKFNTGISLRDSLADFLIEQSNRCEKSSFTNITGITCRTALGEPYDCTAACSCTDPITFAARAGTDCRVYTECSGGCGCDDATGHLVPGKTDCPEYAQCQARISMGQQRPLSPQTYDLANLPCLDASVEPHDGRIYAVSQ